MTGGAVADEQLRERLRRQQRHVGVRDDDGALRCAVERLERDVDGVARAVLLLLHGLDDRRVVRRDGLGDLLAIVADDGDCGVHAGAGDGDQCVLEHAASGDLVQDLGARGLHARARSRRQHDGCDFGRLTRLLRRRTSGSLLAPRVGVEPTSLVRIQSAAGPAGRPTGERPQNQGTQQPALPESGLAPGNGERTAERQHRAPRPGRIGLAERGLVRRRRTPRADRRAAPAGSGALRCRRSSRRPGPPPAGRADRSSPTRRPPSRAR